MIQRTCIITTAVLLLVLIIGCSSGMNSPVAPDTVQEMSQSNGDSILNDISSKQLWGFFDVSLNIDTETIDITPDRTVTYNLNATQFLNNHPLFLGTANPVIIPSSPPGSWIDADIDIILQHPFPGNPLYNGFDVMIALISNGSGTMQHNSSLTYGVDGADVMMMDDPVNGDGGGPDGYTRWFNPPEFINPGLFGYTVGKIAMPGFTGNSTVNPYKLFADGMTSHEPAFDFVSSEGGPGNNVFMSGNQPVTRNMYIRFPINTPPILKYNYAIIASWDGHLYPSPMNTTEVVAAKVTVSDDIYYIDPVINGGDLILDISLAGYGSQPSAIIIESTVMSVPYTLNSTEMIPITTTPSFSNYTVTIPDVDNVQGLYGNEMWIIAQYNGVDKTEYGYKNVANISNLAGDDPREAYFRFRLFVSNIAPNTPPVCDFQVVSGTPYNGPAPHPVEFDASGSTDDFGIVKYEYDFKGVGYVDYGMDATPTYNYVTSYSGPVWVRITDTDGLTSECSVDVDIIIQAGPNKNIGLRDMFPWDLAVDHNNGDLLVLYIDGQVWRYGEDSGYSAGEWFYDSSTEYRFIDIAPSGDSIVGGRPGWEDCTSDAYSPTGDFINNLDAVLYDIGIFDVMGVTSTSYYNQLCIQAFWSAYGSTTTNWRDRTYEPPDYPYADPGPGEWHQGPSGIGIGNCYPDYFVASECSNEESMTFYTIEHTDWTVEKWIIEGEGTDTLQYAGIYWGGVQSDDMSGFNEPKDITRDNNNYYYILDKLSDASGNEPRVKKYSSTGDPIGPFGDPSTISGNPLRIEGSDFDGRIYVLHVDELNNAQLSVFEQSEIPQ